MASTCKLYPPSQQGAYYTPPVYAAQPHVIHHTTVVQPNSIPSTALYPAPVPVPAPRNNGMAAMGMVAGTTMAMSAGGSLTSAGCKQLSDAATLSAQCCTAGTSERVTARVRFYHSAIYNNNNMKKKKNPYLREGCRSSCNVTEVAECV